MKIIITVDFSNNKFNSDFALSNALLGEHTVLLVTSEEQLKSSLPAYDMVIIGLSSFILGEGILENIKVLKADQDTNKTMAKIQNYRM